MTNSGYLSNAHFKVIGLGGTGCQMVSQMAATQIPPPSVIEYIAMDTDAQSLAMADVPNRIQLGKQLLHGLDSGNDSDIGRQAAVESKVAIRQAIIGADIVFIITAMGGGTGTGSAPVIAEMARHMGALTIGMVTTPFPFEGTHRIDIAYQGIDALLMGVDSLVTIPQDLSAMLPDGKTGVRDVFQVSCGLMTQGVELLTQAICSPGLINLDVADVRSILKETGLVALSVGCASGKDRAAQAAYAALANPALGATAKRAGAALFNATGNSNLTLFEVNAAADVIRSEIAPDANVLFSVNCDEKMGDEMKIALLVTKFIEK